eukprot:m.63102 g.63102  ORF g.63102 m.63102 type:complete len:496 (-) comp8132_c0_seq2:1570-3057(-)
MGVKATGAGRTKQYSKSIGLRAAIGLILGVVIGSGIFSSPGLVTTYVKSPGATVLVWFVSGVISLLGGWCYCELGAALPFTGGETVYLERAFGRKTAFLYVWVSTTVARPASVALSAIVSSDYACSVLWDYEDEPADARWATAAVVIATCCVIQMTSTFLTAITLSLMTSLKMVLILSLCLLGIFHAGIMSRGTSQLDPQKSFIDTETSPGDWVLALVNCLYAYNGWNMLNLAASEVDSPSTTIPWAIHTGLLTALVSFLWINISYLMTLDIDDISGSTTLAVDFTKVIVGDLGGTIVAGGVALSALGTCHGLLFAGTQAIRESGRSQLLPRIFAGQLQLCRDVTPTPVFALFVQSSIAILMVYFLEGFEEIVRVYVWTQWVFFSMAIFALVTLRWLEPELDRPYRVWLAVPVLFVGISVFMVFVLFFLSPGTCAVAMVALFLGVPAWYLHQYLLRRQGAASLTDPDDIHPLLVTRTADPHHANVATDTHQYKTL